MTIYSKIASSDVRLNFVESGKQLPAVDLTGGETSANALNSCKLNPITETRIKVKTVM